MNFLKNIIGIFSELDQRWGDIWYNNGQYIQKNVISGQYRLLKDSFNNSNHAVILLHGIGRTKYCMRNIASKINHEGFVTINVSYPSLFGSLEDHSNQIRDLIRSLNGIDTVSFVGYSLGGLVIRQILSKPIKFNIGKVVQIGTPNNGATMTDICKNLYTFKKITGDCGQILRTDRANELKPLECDFGIIAGGTGYKIGYNPLLHGDNDGLVKVSETYMNGFKDFLLVKSDHHFLIQKKETIRATINFLKYGKFS